MSITITDGAGDPVIVKSTITADGHTTHVRLDIPADLSVATLDLINQGLVAHDDVDIGNPAKIGTRTVSSMSGNTPLIAGRRSDTYSDLDGALIVRMDRTLGDLVSGVVTNTNGSITPVIAAAGTGVKVYLTDIAITNSSATSVAVEVKDGTTARWIAMIPASGGISHQFSSPLVGSPNTAWNMDAATATTSIYASFSGFKSKV